MKFAGIPHPVSCHLRVDSCPNAVHHICVSPTDCQGLIGTAPSQELLDIWNKRERALVAAYPQAVPDVALLPNPTGAYVGQDLPDSTRRNVYTEGARTIPGREHGGNVDIKNLSRGSRGEYGNVGWVIMCDGQRLICRLFPRIHRGCQFIAGRSSLCARGWRALILRGYRNGNFVVTEGAEAGRLVLPL